MLAALLICSFDHLTCSLFFLKDFKAKIYKEQGNYDDCCTQCFLQVRVVGGQLSGRKVGSRLFSFAGLKMMLTTAT